MHPGCPHGCISWEEKKDLLRKVIAAERGRPGALIPVMHRAQELFGHLPYEIERMIALGLEVPLADVYGVATFYSKFTLEPKGKYQISVCMGTACYVKGAQQIVDKLADMLQVHVGGTTKDGAFSLTADRCIGACGLAPVMMIDGTVYGQMTLAKTEKIINGYLKMAGGKKRADTAKA
jgi:NADH:ubiquinone oxidoreductase subunit E